VDAFLCRIASELAYLKKKLIEAVHPLVRDQRYRSARKYFD